MSVSRGSGSLRTFSIGTRWASMIAQVVFLGRVLARSWRQTFARRGVSSRPVVALTLIGLVASLAFSVVLVPLAGPASATSPAGTGGMFTPLQARLADTRSGLGGYSTPIPANTNRVYQVTGNVGVPSTGVSAVMLSMTALTPNIAGNMSATSNPPMSCTTTCTVLTWAAGETVSNSSVVGVASNGQIVVNSNYSTEDMLIDVQGYFLTGNGTAAPGGYVPVAPTRIVDTRSGLGAPKAQVATGSSLTV